jgi:hypothetical protein
MVAFLGTQYNMPTQVNNSETSLKNSTVVKPKFKTWLKRGLILLLAIAVISVLWVEYQMRLLRGEYSDVIETTDIQFLSGDYIIKDVSVLNPEGTDMLAGQDVIISNGQIKQLGLNLKQPQSMATVAGEGMYLIPGLMDGHVHLTEARNTLWLFLANGVTHLRDMGGNNYHLRVRDERSYHPLWPDVFVASEKVYSIPWYKAWFTEWTRTQIALTDAEKTVELVNELKAQGYDALKISNGLMSSHYISLVEAAQQADLLVVGHIPNNSLALDQLLTMGQQEIAHVEELTKAFSREYELTIREMNAETVAEYLKYVEIRSQEVAKILKAKDIYVTSVIWLIESLPKQKFALQDFLKTVELEYIDPPGLEGTPLTRGWLPEHHSYASDAYWLETPKRRAQLKLFWDTYIDAIHIMTRAINDHQVNFMAGTDAITAGAVPGFSLHDELQSLVNIGMSPSQALQTTTRTPGQWLDKVNKNPQSGQLGSIKPGYQANLVLLRENPLDSIHNTRSIESVIINGNLLNRAQLDQILSRIKASNATHRNKGVSEYL